MTSHELEPQPRSIEQQLSDGVTLLLGKHSQYVYHNEPVPTLLGEELHLRTPAGRFYRVLRVTRLSDEGARAMDSLARTHAVGERLLLKNTSDEIRRKVTGGLTEGVDDFKEELVLTNALTADSIPLTTVGLDEWFAELDGAEPMEFQVPIGE